MELTIGTRHELGMSWIVPQLDALAARFSHVDFHLYFGSGPDLVLRVRTLEIDCAVTSTRIADPRLDAIRLHQEDYVFVAAPALLRKTPLSRSEHVHAHTLLDTSADLPLFRYFRDAAVEHSGSPVEWPFHRIVRLGSIDAIRARVLAGAGVAVLPRYLVSGDLKNKRLRRIYAGIEPQADHFRLIFRASDPRRSVFASLAEALVESPLR